MNEPAFLQAGDDVEMPAGNIFKPLGKEAAIVTVAQGASGYHAGALNRITLHRAMKPPENFQGMRHGLRIKAAIAEHAFSQPRDFTVLMQSDKTSPAEFSNAEPD